MSDARILVAGIGNIFLGDDAFGSEVARRLLARGLPAAVKVEDFGIRGFDVAYALMDPYDVVILVDAVPRGEPPGTVYVIEPDLAAIDAPRQSTSLIEPHTMNPMAVLELVKVLGGKYGKLLLVGCEPADLGGEEGRMGLSPPVADGVERAIQVIESLVTRIQAGEMPFSETAAAKSA